MLYETDNVEMLSFCVCFLFISVPFRAQGLLDSKGCSPDEFSCNNGHCIYLNQWCDSVKDCPDGVDEQFCETKRNELGLNTNKCPTGFFECRNGLCIPISGRCDGYNSCGDSSDEADCPKRTKVPSHSKSENELDRSTAKRSSLKLPRAVNYTHGYQNHESTDDFYNGYDELDAENYVEHVEKARKWLLSQRKEDYSWGDDTERALVALNLSEDDVNLDDRDHALMEKQLHIRLSIALARNETKRITPSDLALFINAIQTSCGDPRNFYGFDLVLKLREMVDFERRSGKFAMPFLYLTLCLNNVTSRYDLQELQNVFLHRHRLQNKKDMKALTLLAIICLERGKNVNAPYSLEMKNKLIQDIGGALSGNLYEVALVIQAFNEARVNREFWNRDEAIKFVLDHQNSDGSFGDVLATYYVLPILVGKSLLSLGYHCQTSSSKVLTPVEVLKNGIKRIYVTYGIHYGYPMEMSQTMIFKVSPGTTLFDIMRLAEDRSQNYRFELDKNKDKLTVYSIGGIPNDAERGIYWMLYYRENPQNLGIRPNLSLTDEDPKNLVPRGGEDIVFWRRPL